MKLSIDEEEAIKNFVKHYVWHNPDLVNNEDLSLCKRLENRLNEMLIRRKRLLKSLCKKQRGNISSTEIELINRQQERQKTALLSNFRISQLEEMLKSSTKSIARDVVSTLVPADKSCKGILVILNERMQVMKDKQKVSDGSFNSAETDDGSAQHGKRPNTSGREIRGQAGMSQT